MNNIVKTIGDGQVATGNSSESLSFTIQKLSVSNLHTICPGRASNSLTQLFRWQGNGLSFRGVFIQRFFPVTQVAEPKKIACAFCLTRKHGDDRAWAYT